MSRLDNTERCPVGEACVVCDGAKDLAVATADTLVGTMCLTLCGDCALLVECESVKLPNLSIHRAAQKVLAHCQHVGLDLDQAAAIRERERGEDQP